MKRIPDEVSGSAGPAVENWARSFWSTTSESPDLPPHHPDCLGCGPQNPHGHALSVQRDENGVVAHHVFDQRHVGAPGIAHGGAVATVLDDLFGFLLYTVGELAVTRRLELDYLAPVLLGTPYVLRAAVRSRDGRKLDLTATMDDAQGRSVATATALFVVVEVEHFMQSKPEPNSGPRTRITPKNRHPGRPSPTSITRGGCRTAASTWRKDGEDECPSGGQRRQRQCRLTTSVYECGSGELGQRLTSWSCAVGDL